MMVTSALHAHESAPTHRKAGISALAGFLGFGLLFSPYIIAGRDSAPRLTDLVGGILWLLVPALLLTGHRLHRARSLRLLVVVWLVLAWVLRDAYLYGLNPQTAQVRWVLAIPYAYLLATLSIDPAHRRRIAIGIFWGAVGNLWVVGMQLMGHNDLILSLGLTSPRFDQWWVHVRGVDIVRPVGMWGHPNASAGVIALALPAALGAGEGRRSELPWLLAGLAVAMLGSALTLTRSAALVGGFVALTWIFLSRGAVSRQARLGLLGVFLIGGILVGPPGGWDRWTSGSNATNQFERQLATQAALQLAVEHPLGLGSGYQVALREATGGIPATHNAWLYLALVAGLPLTLLVLGATLRLALRLRRHARLEVWVAITLLGLAMFEEYFRAPIVQILALFLLATDLPKDAQS